MSDAIGLELERREKMANKCNHNFGDEDSCCKCGQFWWDVLAERKANIDALTIEVGELYHDIERYIAITSEQQARIEALEKAAQGARSLLWNMQNGRVLEYSKPMIAMAIKDIDAALQEPDR